MYGPMRESGSSRERETDFLGREGSQLAINGKGGKRDFREGLVSIFVDNLNPVVDNSCLWDVFRPFGRVRDVFLSSKINGRGSMFAFIRFGTMMEAMKVVKLTNGIHIYGWPVKTKVAAHDWSQRRTRARKEVQRRASLVSSSEETRVDRWPRLSHLEKPSYVEVVEGQKKEVQARFLRDKNAARDDNDVVMSWDGSKSEDRWIERCAVGILHNFSSVQSVSKRLCNRDLSFSSIYLCDKSIVWEFDTENVRDGFIKNNSLWDDCFSSMGRLTDSDVPKSRLVWVNCSGFPLRCWSEMFFKKVGWLFGEPVLLAEETKSRRRIDRGRMLVLIPNGHVCPRKIRIEEGTSSFEVMVEEEGTPLEFSWLENFLGLKMKTIQASSNSFPVKESLAGVSELDGEPGLSLSMVRDDMDKRGICGDGQLILTGAYDRNQINEFQNSNKEGKGCGKDERLSDKSTYFHLRKDKVNRKVSFSRDVKEKMVKVRAVSSTFSDAESVSSLVLCSRFGKGESMIQPGRSCKVGSFKWDSGCGLEGKESGLKVNGLGRALVERASSEFECPTQGIKMKDHSGKGPVSPIQVPEIGKARRSVDAGEGLEEAFGVKEGEVGKVKKAYWNIKEELAKVIKAGVDLGFDFKGRENDMVEEIVRRIKVGSYGKLEGILPFKNN